ncbi:MAG: hypothetical protein AB7L17_23835 [Ilumatobacteraceae bacterium]|jgi:hypothetical protein
MKNMRFPSEAELATCGVWCAPLHKVERAIAGQPFARFFHIEDFMCMGMVRRSGRPDLILNKHRLTRMYLNLDADGHAYRYLAPKRAESTSTGQYRPHKDLVAAIDHLRLFEMPWLAGSGHHDDALGLPWERRFDHPDVIAWYGRKYPR